MLARQPADFTTIDTDSPPDEVGHVLAVTRGAPPEGLAFGDAPLRLPKDGDGSRTFTWIDGDTDEQEPVDFAISVRAIDVDGHLGPPTDPISVVDPGR